MLSSHVAVEANNLALLNFRHQSLHRQPPAGEVGDVELFERGVDMIEGENDNIYLAAILARRPRLKIPNERKLLDLGELSVFLISRSRLIPSSTLIRRPLRPVVFPCACSAPRHQIAVVAAAIFRRRLEQAAFTTDFLSLHLVPSAWNRTGVSVLQGPYSTTEIRGRGADCRDRTDVLRLRNGGPATERSRRIHLLHLVLSGRIELPSTPYQSVVLPLNDESEMAVDPGIEPERAERQSASLPLT